MSSGSTTGMIGRSIGAGKIEVALVMGRAAENGAGAVIHEHEIGDIDWQDLVFEHRMFHVNPGEIALLLRLLDHFGGVRAEAMALGNKILECRIVLGQRRRQRMIGRQSHE